MSNKSRVAVRAYSPGNGKAGTGGPLGLVGELIWLGSELQVQRESLSQKLRWRAIEEDT